MCHVPSPCPFCRYADFLSRLNDDINIRALFERALSLLPPEESVEVLFSEVKILLNYYCYCADSNVIYLFFFVVLDNDIIVPLFTLFLPSDLKASFC